MKLTLALLTLISGSFLNAALPLSTPITQGDKTIMLGHFSPARVAEMMHMDPDLMYYHTECAEVFVKTTDANTGRFLVTVLTKSGKRQAFATASVQRDPGSEYTVVIVPTGDFEEITDVWVQALPKDLPTEQFTDNSRQ
jgi:hypothetical protein